MSKFKSDNIYSAPLDRVSDFTFDHSVAEVFDDMIHRSVPGYSSLMRQISTVTTHFAKDGANYYDLGCSLGTGLLAMGQVLTNTHPNLIGVDTSQSMLDKASQLVQRTLPDLSITFRHEDISETALSDAAMILLNYTLQFLPVASRTALIQRIHGSLIEGGALILSEKVHLPDDASENLITSLHHQFKALQGYSELEISQKRDAIENVLIPETLATHVDRLKDAGFSTVTPWFQQFNFISILAIK